MNVIARKIVLWSTALFFIGSGVGFAASGTLTGVTAGFPTSLQDELGNQLENGRLALIIIDSAGDGITLSNATFSIQGFYNGSDDYFLTALGTLDVGGGSTIASGGGSYLNVTGLDANDPFYIAWFADVNSGETTLDGGDWFGLTRNLDWVLPSDGGTFTGSIPADGGLATLQVQPVPEPSSYVLMIGGLITIAYMQMRRKK